MRLVSIEGRLHALVANGARAIDLGGAASLPTGPCQFLAAGGLDPARGIVADAEARLAADPTVPIGVDMLQAGLRVQAPIPKPRMIWCIGINYRDHAAETGRSTERPVEPTVFAKSPGALIAHEDTIVVPPNVTKPDWEGEVALVIGRRARDVTEADALSYLAGVTAANDVSARDHQFTTTQFTWSKSIDTFCPLGPVLVTIDEVDVGNLDLTTRVNGAVMQRGNTRDLIFSIPELIMFLSAGVTLEPGDVILTGTPAGVGNARTPPVFLADGDTVEVTVDGVCTLRNRVSRPG
jgi:2-keto-4-pentenoate hydratase/2-oxohepta-3-ene-1,7-dioic acid hydratase in catechol pathway